MQLSGTDSSRVQVVVGPLLRDTEKRFMVRVFNVLWEFFLGHSPTGGFPGLTLVSTTMMLTGLDQCGLESIFRAREYWFSHRTEPFVVSFACVGRTAEDRLREFQEVMRAMRPCIATNVFAAPIALEIDFSSLGGVDLDDGVGEEIRLMIRAFEGLRMLGASIGFRMRSELKDAVGVRDVMRGAGFLTVASLKSSRSDSSSQEVADFVRRLRLVGFTIPIVAEVGGVEDMNDMIDAGADAVRVNSALVRSSELRAMIRLADRIRSF